MSLLDVLNRKLCLVMNLSSLGEYWGISNQERRIISGDALVALCKETQIVETINWLQSYFPEFDSNTEFNLVAEHEEFCIFQINVDKSPKKELVLKNGSFVDCTSSSNENVFEWLGGVCVDYDSNKFLKEFLPTHINRCGEVFELKGKIMINSRVITWEIFYASIVNLEMNEAFQIEFEDGFQAVLKIAVKRRVFDYKIGFEVDNKSLSPSSSNLPISSPSLRGFKYDRCENNKRLNIISIAALVNSQQVEKVQLIDDFQDIVEQAIINSIVSESLKSTVLQRIRTSKMVPSIVLTELGLVYE